MASFMREAGSYTFQKNLRFFMASSASLLLCGLSKRPNRAKSIWSIELLLLLLLLLLLMTLVVLVLVFVFAPVDDDEEEEEEEDKST